MQNLFQSCYYLIKPYVPKQLLIFLRRRYLDSQLPRHSHLWPINENAGKPPEGWQGWPENKKFALVLTHDVEDVKGLNKCRQLAELEMELGFRSLFNFVAEDYKQDNELWKFLISNGFEIGLHGLTHKKNMFRSRKVFLEQVPRLNRYLREWGSAGFRGPSMYRNLDWFHDLNIEYDASTFDTDPFEPQPDAAGTIFPTWIAHPSNGNGYIELPYTLPQDFTLFILMQEKDNRIWQKKLDWIAQRGGTALIITHPDYMYFNRDKKHAIDEYSVKHYRDYLKYIKSHYENQYWHVLPRALASYWKKNYGPMPDIVRTTTKIPEVRKPLRVCMLAYAFYESDGRIRRYAETLAKRGDQVEAIALGKEGQPFYEIIEGVHVYRIQKRLIDEKGELSYLFKLMKFFILSMIFISKRHYKNSYDMIHVHSVPDFEVFATLLPKLMGAKVILDIHDIVPEFYSSKFNKTSDSVIFKALAILEKASIAFSDHVIISNHIWEKTLLSRSASSQKCSVVLNYPDPAIFFRREKNRNDNRFIIIYPGSLNWHQGLDIAIRAFALIKDQVPTADLYIYGRGPEKDNLIALVKKLGLNNRVFIKDTVPLHQIADIIANADLGIIPKRNNGFGGEAFSTKILEFMCLRIPVLVAETTIDRHYFNDSVVKFFAPDDVKHMSECLLELINSKNTCCTLSNNALNFVEDYNWDGKKAEYLNLVDSLVLTNEGNSSQEHHNSKAR